ENSQASNLPKHQIKFALATLRAIKRLKDSGPFLHPVDALKLNVPTYYDTVKRPMDISTMEKKLQTGAYTKISDFGLDMELIVYNCCLFNGTDSFISNMARSVKSSFEKHMGNMPLYELPASVFATNSTSSEASPAFALTPSGIPMIRRDSSVDGRPKREIHPPKPKDLPYSDIRPRKKKYAAELKFCGQLLKELMGKKYEAVSFPFLAPVDPVALNCPTYYKIIKHPMDLSTVQEKINSNQYETADEFEADIKLMFKNCYKFNPAGSPVNDMGRELEAVFDKRWLEKPARLPTPPPSHYYSDDESSGFDSDDEDAINAMTNPAISFLEQQLERMKLDLYKMKKDAARELKRTRSLSRKKRKKSISTSNNGDGAIRRRSSASEPLTVTYEMKKELSEKIYNLSEKRIAHVITIIHESMPELKGGDDDEIELDMDQLDPKTVLKLYKYVVSDK
ncbi:Bromodomain-containing protein, partial [Nadsonia fulvescens var. elongata DSM 6958]